MYEKLIRDLIPDIARAEGRLLSVRRAGARELPQLLLRKLFEEALEVNDAIADTRGRFIEELADLQTVVDDLATRHGITPEELRQAVEGKRQTRGGFESGIVLAQPLPARSRVHVGRSESLVDALKAELSLCANARLAVSFVMTSGLQLMEGALRAALLRGASIELLTTDYLGVTEPAALERLLAWPGKLDVRVFSHAWRSFHPKAYIFERPDGSGRAFIGSANFSAMGLRDGVEWTWSVLDVDPGHPMAELRHRFDELFDSRHSRPITPEWIAGYACRRQPLPETAERRAQPLAPTPRPVQSLILNELERLRADGERRALVVAATGLGKTYLAAFDSALAERVLFIAHRQELLFQAAAAYRSLYPERTQGFVMEGREDFGRDCVFASIQALSNAGNVDRPELATFDYVVIDEFHHAAADTYQRVLRRLSPSFLLGITATPFRGDNRDLLEICDGNLAYQVGLFDAITYGWLAPFHYYGIADTVVYSDDLLSRSGGYDAGKLTVALNTEERAVLALNAFRRHRSRAALGFCVSIEHAEFMAASFRRAGVASAAVHSGPTSADRSQAISGLALGEFAILFTVDMFNEGVDIPVVDLVMFLRPTESMTVFLQQLGRGLRLHDDKPHLTVLDFIGNYRKAHFKLPFLVGLDLAGDAEPAKALRALQVWQAGGDRPEGLPEGIRIELEPVALSALQNSLRSASPLRQSVVDDVHALAAHFRRAPSLVEWHRYGRYSLATARTALNVDRWALVLRAAGAPSEEEDWLDAQVGPFLRELERTSMTKSFKMVVLLAMCRDETFETSIGMEDLVTYFRSYFNEERHRLDVGGTRVEDAPNADQVTWENYLQANPINAWIGGNTTATQPFFQWKSGERKLVYVGPRPKGRADAQERFAKAVRDRVLFRLEQYWGRPGPGRFVYKVIPLGTVAGPSDEEPGAGAEEAATEGRNLCIMFGAGPERTGLPTGWHPVRINGLFFYGKFVKVAMNVLKRSPVDERSVPNELTEQLRQLLEGRAAPLPASRMKVRLIPLPGEAAWEIQAA